LNEILDKKTLRSCWVESSEAKVYIRISKRYIDGQITECLDLATIEVFENSQNKGVFKEILQKMEDFATKNNLLLYVENVLNDLLSEKLETYGYKQINSDITPCFIKSFESESSIKS